MISIENVSKQFGSLVALHDVTLNLAQGKSYALIGPNGSGKTTLFKSLLGLVIPDRGVITVDGQSIANSWEYREKIGYMPQIGRYPENMRITQLIDMIKDIRQMKGGLDEELIVQFGLNSIGDKRMHTLSGGTRQKVSAAIAFLFSPPILILDEPTAGLDPVSVECLKEKIQREKDAGKLMIISSHVMSDLDDLTTDALYLFEGKMLYNDTIGKLKTNTGEDRLGKAVAKMITESFSHNQIIAP